MDTDSNDQQNDQPAYPDGVTNSNRIGMLPIGVASSPLAQNTDETIRIVSEALNRPAHFVDQDGYEHEITAGAVHSIQGWIAWVEYRCKRLETGNVDIEFRLKAQVDGRIVINWPVETYNPFFGCRVGYMAWHGDRVVVVYREKHDTYVCSLAIDGTKELVQIAHQWIAVGNQITFRSDEPDLVERLALPELRRLESIPANEARYTGILPTDYDHWNEWNKNHYTKKPKMKGLK